MLWWLSLIAPVFAHDPVAASNEIRLIKTDNRCQQQMVVATVPARSTTELRFVTDPTYVFWASFDDVRDLQFRLVSGFEGSPAGVDPMLRVPEEPGNVWVIWKHEQQVPQSRIFVVEVKNPTKTPVEFLVFSGITEQGFGVMLGEKIDCLP